MRSATKSGIQLVPHSVPNWQELVPNLVPNLLLERLPDLVPCLVHTRYQMVLGAVAASERTASKGAGGMGEAFRFLRGHTGSGEDPESSSVDPRSFAGSRGNSYRDLRSL